MIVATLAQCLWLPRVGPPRVEPYAADSLADIAAYARSRYERIVWLANDEQLNARLDDPGMWAGAETSGRPGHIDGGTFGRRTENPVIMTRSDDPRWQIAEHDRELLPLGRLLARLRDAVDDEPSSSPAATGLGVLRRWLSARHALYASSWAALPPVPLSAQGIHFLRPERYQGETHIFLMDRTAAYLNAARNGSFGLTGVSEVQVDRYEPRAYGAWLIDDWRIPPEVSHLVCLPRRGPCWVMTNTLVWLEELGVTFTVARARLWPTRHRLMREWADAMIMARAIHPCGKQMANGTFGMFAHRARVTESPWWYRPDWRAHICATNALTTGRTIRKLEEGGHAVIAAYEDMIAIASNELDPPVILTNRETVIGGWHLQATYKGGNSSHAVLALRKADNVVAWLGVLHAH